MENPPTQQHALLCFSPNTNLLVTTVPSCCSCYIQPFYNVFPSNKESIQLVHSTLLKWNRTCKILQQIIYNNNTSRCIHFDYHLIQLSLVACICTNRMSRDEYYARRKFQYNTRCSLNRGEYSGIR